MYEETKGISLKDFGVADETAMRKELVLLTQSSGVGVQVLFQLQVIFWNGWNVLIVFLNALAAPQ